MVVLVNHLKSKGYGGKSSSDARRKAQATQVGEIYRRLLKEGVKHIAVIGDLNDTPDSAPLAPLITGTTLKDAFTHPAFDDGGYPGTYGACNASNKIDYLLLAPAPYATVQAGGVTSTAPPSGRPRRPAACSRDPLTTTTSPRATRSR